MQNNVDIKRVKEKISIEVAWNDLIVKTFANEIEIDRNLMIKELEKFDEKEVENLLLSEIIFTINEKKELKPKYEEIKNQLFATVKIVSEIISVKKNSSGNVIEGNPDRIKLVTDNWKFSKKSISNNPNWFLSEIISK